MKEDITSYSLISIATGGCRQRRRIIRRTSAMSTTTVMPTTIRRRIPVIICRSASYIANPSTPVVGESSAYETNVVTPKKKRNNRKTRKTIKMAWYTQTNQVKKEWITFGLNKSVNMHLDDFRWTPSRISGEEHNKQFGCCSLIIPKTKQLVNTNNKLTVRGAL